LKEVSYGKYLWTNTGSRTFTRGARSELFLLAPTDDTKWYCEQPPFFASWAQLII